MEIKSRALLRRVPTLRPASWYILRICTASGVILVSRRFTSSCLLPEIFSPKKSQSSLSVSFCQRRKRVYVSANVEEE